MLERLLFSIVPPIGSSVTLAMATLEYKFCRILAGGGDMLSKE